MCVCVCVQGHFILFLYVKHWTRITFFFFLICETLFVRRQSSQVKFWFDLNRAFMNTTQHGAQDCSSQTHSVCSDTQGCLHSTVSNEFDPIFYNPPNTIEIYFLSPPHKIPRKCKNVKESNCMRRYQKANHWEKPLNIQ